MKKILPVLSLSVVIAAACSNAVSVNIGDKDGHKYLNSLKDFDWKNIDYGDGLEYENKNKDALAEKEISDAINEPDFHTIPVDSKNKGRYLDYSKYSTWFQYKDALLKQAVTGSPLNEGFMPNGNYASDFGITSRAQKYLSMNSILDWNDKNDKDARYNRSYTPLRKTKPVAFAYENEKNPDVLIKNKDMRFNYLGFSSRKHRTYDNTVVGTKNPFEGTNLNWQYTSNFVNWSGSWFEGPIIPPPADTIDIAHNNGTPIYGNIFLDGSHGLTKNMLRDFVATDKQGNYLVVDFLLNLAQYNGFDGYFLNDESNGFDPNGTVLDYNVLVNIVKQFNEKSEKLNLNKKIIFYKAWCSFAGQPGDYNDQELYAMTKTMPDNKPLDIQVDFGELPISAQNFVDKSNGVYKPNNIYGIVDQSWNNHLIGTYDWRQLGYGTDGDGEIIKEANKDTFYSSISGYMDNGAVSFGSKALEYLNKYEPNMDENRKYVFATEVTNLFNDIEFNGVDSNINLNNSGLTFNGTKNDYKISASSRSAENLFILNDPRIDLKDKEINLDNKKTAPDTERLYAKDAIYNYAQNGGHNTNSYGVGNLIQEKTVFEDADKNVGPIRTNFSTGSGIKFVDRNKENSAIVTNNYPFSNRRLADVLPTYQWDINEVDKPINEIDPLNAVKTRIDQLSGFYDYDDVYKKTNSIALGSKFDETGMIKDGIWDTSKKYIWNVIGTNISSKNHTFSLTYKDDNNTDISPILTVTNENAGVGNKNKYELVNAADIVNTSEETKDGWKTVTFNLKNSDISENNKLSKIGLMITPKKSNFKFNIGEFSMDYSGQEKENSIIQDNIKNLVSEYRIERNISNKNLVNLRFTYENELKPDDFDYIEFYIKEKDKNNWYRVGETIANEYFIKDIDTDIFGSKIQLAAVTIKDNSVVGCSKYEIN